MSRHIRILLASMAAALGTVALAGCAGSSSSGDAGPAVAPKAKTDVRTIKIALAQRGCTPGRISVPTGLTKFHVENRGTTGLSEFEIKDHNGLILGEREFLLPGRSGHFTLDLFPGNYILNCPNSTIENNGLLTVTGQRKVRPAQPGDELLQHAVTGYDVYVQKQAVRLLAGTREFVAALERGDLERAKALYGPVRFYFELIEPVAESFGDLDPAIDARVNDVATDAEWTGFHRIEHILWVKKTARGSAVYGRKLLADVQELVRRVRSLRFQPAQMANGAVGLLNEVANAKITGEEDRYSHTDLSDFAANLAGAETAFDLLRPALDSRGKARLTRTIAARFAAVRKGLAAYERDTELGFALYDELTDTDRRRFAAQIDALAEPLSTLAVLLPSVPARWASGKVRVAAALHGKPEAPGVTNKLNQRAEISIWPTRGQICWEIYLVGTGVLRPMHAEIHDWTGKKVLTFANPWGYEDCGRASSSVLRAIAGHPHNYQLVVTSKLHPRGAVRGRF